MSHQQANHQRSLNLFVSVLSFFLFSFAQSQQNATRSIQKWNAGWLFTKSDIKSDKWQAVNLPHTWNTDDVMDDEPGYYRGIGWYKKTFTVEESAGSKKHFVHFEGANQETEVYINGKKAGHHVGGYTAFIVPISDFLKKGGQNEVLIKVGNSHNTNIPPLTADFTFYGGIYRDVHLVTTNSLHFDHTKGSNGVFITTPFVTNENAQIVIKAVISNEAKTGRATKFVATVYDKQKRKVAEVATDFKIAAGLQKAVEQKIHTITTPRLWTPDDPYLYTVETKLLNSKGQVLDILTNPLGFRWFRFDADKGFYLNGSPYRLVGASRHQDFKGLGNAVPDDIAINDVVLLKNMGANFLRVAHYPQDPSVLKACDSLGLLASVEIPIVNEITETDAFYTNCERMMAEMIRQNFNHPSVIMWCYMNEVLLRPQFNNDKARQQVYFNNIKALAQRLENLTRKEDPYRYTMMANHGNLKQYQSVGLLEIPMVVGWNLYSGWYGGSLNDFPKFLDEFHRNYPSIPFMVTEYGADADPRIRSAQPVRFDKSVEYTTRFHQFYLSEMLKRPFVSGAIVWNLADFNSETRTETMPHINNKGLLEWNRTPKDPYHFYQAVLKKEPFLKILGSCQTGWGVADSTSSGTYQLVQIATNLDSVVVYINGEKQEPLKTQNGLCEQRLRFREGRNTLVVVGNANGVRISDSVTTNLRLQPVYSADQALPFEKLNIMLGSNRFFTDSKGAWWQPNQFYKEGSWGAIGGRPFKQENNNRLPYGTDKNIVGTEDDPVYQTQQTGIKQYRLNVPAGTYRLTLHFAELLGGKSEAVPYNLSDEDRSEKIEQRIFTVRVNGRPLLEKFNLAKEYGLAKAVAKTTMVTVREREGVLIDFEAIEGEPILNALQLVKLPETVGK